MPLTVEALSSPPTRQDVGAGWGPYYSKGQSSALAPSPIIISENPLLFYRLMLILEHSNRVNPGTDKQTKRWVQCLSRLLDESPDKHPVFRME